MSCIITTLLIAWNNNELRSGGILPCVWRYVVWPLLLYMLVHARASYSQTRRHRSKHTHCTGINALACCPPSSMRSPPLDHFWHSSEAEWYHPQRYVWAGHGFSSWGSPPCFGDPEVEDCSPARNHKKMDPSNIHTHSHLDKGPKRRGRWGLRQQWPEVKPRAPTPW